MSRKVLSYLRKLPVVLFWIVFSVIIIGCFYFFYHPELQIGSLQIANPFFYHVRALPFWSYLVLYFTAFSLLSALLFIALSGYYNVLKNRNARISDRYHKFFAFVLTHYYLTDLYKDEYCQKNLFIRIKPFVRKRIQVESLFWVYTKIQETFTMDLSGKFKRLLEALDLYKKVEHFLYDDNFDNRILAMKLLSYLRINDYDKQIGKYAENKNYALRTEAYAALIRLMKKDEHLVNFVGKKHQLSVLDINIIVNAALKNFKLEIDYRGLLASENHRKIMVGLLLARYNYRKDSKNLILILNHIGNEDPMLNKLAWEALITLVPENEVVDIVVHRFDREPEDVKLFILRNIKSDRNQRLVNFLKQVVKNESLLLKIEAMNILFENDFDALADFAETNDSEIQKAYDETVCVYINR